MINTASFWDIVLCVDASFWDFILYMLRLLLFCWQSLFPFMVHHSPNGDLYCCPQCFVSLLSIMEILYWDITNALVDFDRSWPIWNLRQTSPPFTHPIGLFLVRVGMEVGSFLGCFLIHSHGTATSNLGDTLQTFIWMINWPTGHAMHSCVPVHSGSSEMAFPPRNQGDFNQLDKIKKKKAKSYQIFFFLTKKCQITLRHCLYTFP